MHLLTLGPAGTFSHEAAIQAFPDAALQFANNFDELFDRLAADPSLVGFVPVENSLHGSVDEILDLLRETHVKLWRMVEASINQAFGALDTSAITQVASHTQALRQCRAWLKAHYPHLQHVSVSSTSAAIQMALEEPSTAAIGLASTMAERGLPIIADSIEGSNNTTRFGIVALADPFPNLSRVQMSILIHPHEDYPGLLHKILTPFKIYDVNLTRIENRPVGSKLGDYYFFIDFLGTQQDERTKKVLGELRTMADIKVLGEW